MAQWQEEFTALGVNVAGMSYDAPELLRSFHREQSLGYPLLQDVDAEHVSAYGVRNEEYPAGHRAYGIPHPGILLIDAQGVVRAKYAVPGYRQRPPLERIIEDLQAQREPAGS